MAATLGDQTNQLNKIVDDLNEIEFNMKKASAVIRDIARGLLTDKCAPASVCNPDVATLVGNSCMGG